MSIEVKAGELSEMLARFPFVYLLTVGEHLRFSALAYRKLSEDDRQSTLSRLEQLLLDQRLERGALRGEDALALLLDAIAQIRIELIEASESP